MSKAIASIEQQLQAITLQERHFELMQRKGKLLASCTMIPDNLKNNVPDCIIVTEMSERLNVDPYLIARQMYMVHGKPAFESKFMVGLLNSSGKLRGTLKYQKTGKPGTDSQGCYAYGIDAETGETVEGPEITVAMAKAEQWYDRKGSKWKTMADLMLMYRAASFFINTNYPEIMQGFSTVEEIKDTPREVEGEVISKKRPDPTPQKETIDYETGEIIEQKPTREQDAKAFKSPAFQSLEQEISNSSSVEGLAAVTKLPAFKRCNEKEQQELKEKVDTKLKSFAFQKPENA